MNRSLLPLRFLVFTCLFAWLLLGTPLFATQTATFSWDPGTERDLAGYRLHYGTVADPYSKLVDVKTNSATVSNLVDGETYVFAVTAYNDAGTESGYSTAIFYTAPETGPASTQPPTAPATLGNISSRVYVRTGDNVMIGGFILQGDTPKKVALRVVGPSLASLGVEGTMSDPVLELWNSTGAVIASNDNWSSSDPDLAAAGLTLSDPRESAIVATLPAGSYSAVVRGAGSTTGVALFELYDLDPGHGSVANISTRGRVDVGDKVMIGGFILGGSQGTKVIVRAIGPSLAAVGIRDPLLDPTLELYDSNGTVLSTNDDWRADQQSSIIASNLAPTDDREAAIISTLAPGAYSAVMRGKNDTTGVGLFEVYALSN